MNLLTVVIYTCITAVVVHALFNLLITRRANRLPPGPNLWPIVGNLPHLGKIPHHSLATMATKYGPLMHLRLGFVDVVVVSSASVAAQIFKAHDVNFSSRPKSSFGKHMGYNYQSLVSAPYGPWWRMLRRVCSEKLFSTKALDDFSHVRQEEVAILTSALLGARQSAVRLDQLLNVCSANALSRVMLGRRVFGNESGCVNPKADEFKDMVVELLVLGGTFNVGDFIPALNWMDLQGVVKNMKKLHVRFDSFLSTILKEHEIDGCDTGNFNLLSTLISLKDDVDEEGGKLSDINIKGLLLNLIVAGTDTLSTTVEWAIAELIRHPQLMKHVQKEMDNIIGRDRLVTEADLSQLTFLQAIVKETFRLHPATPLSLPRIASESCEINGFNIPQGSTLLVNVWAIARDPKVWTNPLEFKPSRFLPGGEKPDVDVKGHDFEIIPFGAGRRICVGTSLGLRMVQLLIASLVQAFNWELANGLKRENLTMEEAYALAIRRAEPLMVHPRPRLAPDVYKSV